MRLRLAVAGLLLPFLAACGSETAAPPPAPPAPPVAAAEKPIDVVRVAGEKTADSGSARMAMTVEAPGLLDATGTGVFSLTEPKGSLRMEMRVGGEKVEMEMRILGRALYMKMPQLPTDKPWLRFDLEELTGQELGALSQLQQNDPRESLAYFKGVSEDVREVGKEDVRGVATTRYAGTFDLEKAKAAHPDARARKVLDAAIEKLGGIPEIPMEVWIDAEGRMRKMTQEIDLAKVSDVEASGTMLTTIEMYDFGVAVDVAAPAAGRVADGAKLLKEMQQQ